MNTHAGKHQFSSSKSRQKALNSQSGITLVIGLILLAMLTVVGTIGFRNTTMSERISGNARDRNIAFQAAESAGKEALTAVVANTAAALTSGYYATPLIQGGETSFWTQGDGATAAAAACPTTTPFSWTSCASYASSYAGNKLTAQFVIEIIASPPTASSTTYRITSRSEGGSGNADVVLQTLFTQ